MEQNQNTSINEPDSSAPLEIRKEDKDMAVLVHLLSIFTGFIGPLIIWLVKKEEMPFAGRHAVEALNFQITYLIAVSIAGSLCMVLIGFLLLPVVMIAGIIFMIIATMKAKNGEYYKYPMTLRLIS